MEEDMVITIHIMTHLALITIHFTDIVVHLIMHHLVTILGGIIIMDMVLITIITLVIITLQMYV